MNFQSNPLKGKRDLHFDTKLQQGKIPVQEDTEIRAIQPELSKNTFPDSRFINVSPIRVVPKTINFISKVHSTGKQPVMFRSFDTQTSQDIKTNG